MPVPLLAFFLLEIHLHKPPSQRKVIFLQTKLFLLRFSYTANFFGSAGKTSVRLRRMECYSSRFWGIPSQINCMVDVWREKTREAGSNTTPNIESWVLVMPAASSSESPLLMISISRSSYYKMGKESSLGMIRHIGLIAQCLIFPLIFSCLSGLADRLMVLGYLVVL